MLTFNDLKQRVYSDLIFDSNEKKVFVFFWSVCKYLVSAVYCSSKPLYFSRFINKVVTEFKLNLILNVQRSHVMESTV